MALTPAPHVLSSITITNNTNSVLPISAGVKLQPQQTKTVYLSSVQQQEEMVPRLEKLHRAGKVNYQLTPGVPQDIGAAGGVSIAGTNQSGTSPVASIPSAAALAQTEWYINPLIGNDNNTGTAAAQGSGLVGPLKTAAEYVRRTGLHRVIANPVDIYVGADLPASDPLILTGTVVVATAYLFAHGTNLDVLHTGTLTGYTVPVAATNTLPAVIDALVADWTPYAGKLLRLTSGAQYTVPPAFLKTPSMWIIKDLGAHTGRVSQPIRRIDYQLNLVGFAPAGNETYEIVSPRLLNGGLIVDVKGDFANMCIVEDFEVPYSDNSGLNSTQSTYFNCNFQVFGCLHSNNFLMNCQVTLFISLINSYLSVHGGYLNGATCGVQNGTLVVNDAPVAIRAGSLAFGGNPAIAGGTFGVAAGGGIQIADTTNYFKLTNGAQLILKSDVYGVADAGTMYTVGAGSKMIVAAATNMRIGGAVADIKVAGKTQVYPIAATGLPAAAVQTCSLGNFANAGIFNGNIIDPFTGTAVLTAA